MRWFERGAEVLRREIAVGEGKAGRELEVEEKKRRLAGALCGVVEVWMTDLSYAYPPPLPSPHQVSSM